MVDQQDRPRPDDETQRAPGEDDRPIQMGSGTGTGEGNATSEPDRDRQGSFGGGGETRGQGGTTHGSGTAGTGETSRPQTPESTTSEPAYSGSQGQHQPQSSRDLGGSGRLEGRDAPERELDPSYVSSDEPAEGSRR